MDEKDLVKKILAGDEKAFEAFYQSHKKRLERTAIYFLGAGHPALEDVVQDTFLNALPKLKEFEFRSSLYTWLNHFTVNFCLQAIKKGNKTVATETEDIEAAIKPVWKSADSGLKKILMDEIEALEPEFREVIIKKDIEGLEYFEIAQLLKVAPGTVASRLNRARQALKKKLEKKRELFKLFWKES